MPEFKIDPSWFQVSPWFIVIVVICVIAFIAFAVDRGIRVHRRQASAGREELIGKSAVVIEALKPEGTVLFKGEHWAAVLEEGRVKPGEEVIITRVESLKLYVVKKQ